MHKASFKVTKPGSDEKDSVTAEFSEDEVECLRAYSRYVDELIAVKLVQDGVPCSVKLDYKEGEGTTFTITLPVAEPRAVASGSQSQR